MAITANYQWPVTGGTAPAATANPPQIPTSSVKFNAVAAAIDGDGVSAGPLVFTHNLGITAQELADNFPEVTFEPTVAGAPSWWVSAKATNTVTVSFSGTFAGTFGTLRVKRPDRPTL